MSDNTPTRGRIRHAVRVIWPLPKWVVWLARRFGGPYRQEFWAIPVPHDGKWAALEVGDE